MKNPESMSIEALEQYNQELMANVRQIKHKQKVIKVLLDKKHALEKINKTVENMNETEREALKDALNGEKA